MYDDQRTIQHRVARGWYLGVLAFVPLWGLGLGFLWWAVVPVLFLLGQYGQPGRHQVVDVPVVKRHSSPNILIALGAWLALGIVVSLLSGTGEVSRVPGAAYGAGVWMSAGLMMRALTRATHAQRRQLLRGIIMIALVQGGLTLVAVMLHPSSLSSVVLPSSAYLSNLGSVSTWTVANLAYTDYFGSGVVRSSGVMGTAAWSGGYACMVLILLIVGRRGLLAGCLSRRMWWLAVIASGISLTFSYSRMSWAILALVLVVFVTYRTIGALKSALTMLSPIVLVAGAVMLVFWLPVGEFIQQQDELRPGSSTQRFSLYRQGVSAVLDQGLLTTLAGLGIKPVVQALGVGAGSESSYVSLFVRGGIVAVALFAWFILSQVRHAIENRDWAALALVIGVAIHALVEDLDVGALTLMLLLVQPALMRNIPTADKCLSAGAKNVHDSSPMSRLQLSESDRVHE